MSGLTGAVAKHPAQFSPEIIEVLSGLIEPGTHVFDPFAGLGLRLGKLCDEIGATFSGADIEDWPDRDPRVKVADSTKKRTYPRRAEYVVATSPVYFGNRISSDYQNGPTEKTKMNGRRAYGISLGRALHKDNAARVCKPNQAEMYYALHAKAAKHWPDRVILNVDAPLIGRWLELLWAEGFTEGDSHEVVTQRYIVAGHGDERPTHEYVIDARRCF